MAIWQTTINLDYPENLDLNKFVTKIQSIFGSNNSTSPLALHFGNFEGDDITIYLQDGILNGICLRFVPDENSTKKLSLYLKFIEDFKLTWFDDKGDLLCNEDEWKRYLLKSDARKFIENPLDLLREFKWTK